MYDFGKGAFGDGFSAAIALTVAGQDALLPVEAGSLGRHPCLHGPAALPAVDLRVRLKGMSRMGAWRWAAGELLETLTYRGFWRIAGRYWKMGLGEMFRSVSKAAFVRALQRLLPDIRAEHLEEAPAGIRAQAIA